MHPSLQTINHRPWSLPEGEWRWRQSWLDLAFLHYRVSKKSLSKLLPPGMKLQEYDSTAWVGLVAFRMAGVMRRPFPDLPPFSSFPELNLRTYVIVDGKPGVWFFSLDAASWPIVLGGRYLYGLPYFYAKMRHETDSDWFTFSSIRRIGGVSFKARFRPYGDSFHASPQTFEHWATERYCLYSYSPRNGISRVEVHHAPWALRKAEVDIEDCGLLAAANISPLAGAPRLPFLFRRSCCVFPEGAG